MALFNMLISPLNSFPWVINGLVQAWVSIGRVERYLNLSNLNWLQYYLFNELTDSVGTATTVVELRGASFTWTAPPSSDAITDESVGLMTSSTTVLRDVTLQIKRGHLVGVVGKVGAGKTSLLHALLAEIDKVGDNGRVRIDPRVCAQV